ncbi:MAG TPA: hypothetical protein VMD53_02395 [Rhizomicrobium sp.]|nr:hypothetical protein [Rhizomicrobium sp.]
MKSWTLLAALGVVLSGCTATKTDTTASVAPPPPVVVAAAPRPVLQPAQPGPWRITKTEWTKADEDGFGEFLRRIAESGCTTTTACMQGAPNFYHDSDPPSFLFHADCAKWAYMLRAYYASKNGLPFSYVDKIDGDVRADLRYAKTPNVALDRRDIIDTGAGIDAVAVLRKLHDEVWTATYRMDAASQIPVEQDFYSPKIQPGSIRPGTAIYDTTGHVMIVYNVTADGSIQYMDAHPDESVSRGTYGRQVPASPISLGGGFKNFRPLQLVGAMRAPDGHYIGGHIVVASNEAIADFSLEQYRGNAPDAKDGAKDGGVQFRYNNVPLDAYEYTRAAMSKGGFAFNPVYEIEVTMRALCRDAKAGTPDADARVEAGLTGLHADLSKISALWEKRDLRVVYHGSSLKQTLADTYDAAEHACVMDKSADGTQVAGNPLDPFVHHSPETDVPTLIAQIDDSVRFVGMQPVGN